MSATFESALPRREPVTADRARPDVTVERITVRQSDTDVVKHDTGAFASTGVVVAGNATLRQCRGQVEGGVAQALGAAGVTAAQPRSSSSS
ncbi:molybdopterin-dependent oxidoreductase [Streptomyces sp. NBC_01340]|uniref:molybdopterin cofactor-binding domain-containing protein n=1 Tax=unclassified Streptomyces TaxID=2593676 RepID=UPI002252FA5B|nr:MULTISPECIES: molybdopterin cofactor-binding domain-containing protein [unclassified Streptomyces]MCX4462096.1 molybdopterin-dependent oxidoreductase [Streptomyces sp. NBC_01719]MCX4491004.1 molybdopterin-dependent oxidoreductase [Streptomyces sp. NBC_01728]MCX4594406.1 molybdopterin-dependent oxidoreductase [Streptomyces sp. NBC_01549]WSI36336.1 molybdopterin-dependent oxidoreductase [Streptomyces sp. NBC_01340]